MFKLTIDQFDALADAQVDGFLARARAFIGEHFPDLAQAYGGEGIDSHARLAAGRGSLYGMAGERHVMQLLVLMLLLGADFDTDLPESAQLQEVLGDEEREPDERLDQVFAIVAPHCGGGGGGAA